MSMTHSPSEVIQKYLIDAGVGTIWSGGSDWKVFTDTMPPELPHNCILVKDDSPDLDGVDMRSEQTIVHPGIGILVRGKPTTANLTSSAVKTKAREVSAALDDINQTQVTVNVEGGGTATYVVAAFKKSSDVTFIGQEEKTNRFLFSINGTITIKET